MLKGLGDMMKQAQAMQGRMQEMQAELERTEIEGASGGDLVRITLNGKGDMKRIKLDPSLAKPDEIEVLEDLIAAAHADAKAKSEAHMQQKMSELTGGLKLPGGFKFPGM